MILRIFHGLFSFGYQIVNKKPEAILFASGF